ncbi:hypothetical protein [Megamonas funiformis]|uniref:hypothetical protein n=1 Tax=Megamonas funiformis TaxID=437897 RepID=UPI0022E6CA8B|nr:hypothetical protein [Megamonas funiformis]
MKLKKHSKKVMAIIMSVMIGSTALTGCGNQPEVTETANGNVIVTTHESSFFDTMMGAVAGTMLGNMIGNAIWGSSFSEKYNSSSTKSSTSTKTTTKETKPDTKNNVKNNVAPTEKKEGKSSSSTVAPVPKASNGATNITTPKSTTPSIGTNKSVSTGKTGIGSAGARGGASS